MSRKVYPQTGRDTTQTMACVLKVWSGMLGKASGALKRAADSNRGAAFDRRGLVDAPSRALGRDRYAWIARASKPTPSQSTY
jgi:hypothetical protein